MSVFMSLVILPMSFLSGTFFSLSQVPEAIRIALSFSPLTHTSLCLRASALGLPFPWISMGILLIFGAAFLFGCFLVLKRTSL
jgi:ABC-type multidrug transport system permease subunit